MSKFCSNCGKEVKNDNAIACTECGSAISGVILGGAVGWGSGTLTFLYVVSVIIPLFGAVAGLIGLLSPANRGHGVGILFISFCAWMFWTFVILGLGALA